MKRHALAALIVAAGFGGTAAVAHASEMTPYDSTWAGWSAAATTDAHFTSVTGTWTEPVAPCGTQASQASFWVGLGGGYASTAFYGPIQIGTDSDCTYKRHQPSYYAWWETYPDPNVYIHLRITPGDTLTGTVTVNPTFATLTIRDNTTGATFTKIRHLHLKPVATQSAEWVVEGPYITLDCPLLTPFAPVTFTNASATQTLADGAPHTGSIADPAWNYQSDNIWAPPNYSTAGPLNPTSNGFTVSTTQPAD